MERRFVTKAADHGMSELQLAQLAQQQASNPEVKSFAQQLIKDHTMVNQELMTLAGQKNVKIDNEDGGKDRTYRRLSQKSGTEFDQEFVEQMIDMHEADVKMFEKASTDAKDPALKAFAAKHVDHLRQHLQTAQGLRSTIMPTGRDSSTSSSGSSTYGTGSSTSGSSSSDPTSGTSQSGSTSGSSGLTGSPGVTGGSSTNSGSGTGSGSTTGSSSGSGSGSNR
jgi:putative membrane protein